MALDELLVALRREAQIEVDRLLAEARAAAAQRTALADAAIARQRETSLGTRQRAQESELEAALSAARLGARRQVLAARDRLLVRFFTALRAGCPEAITRPEYLDTLPHRVAAALACVDKADAVVLSAPPSIVAALADVVRGMGRVTCRTDAGVGAGIRVASADGNVEVVDTLEVRIGAQHAALARQALQQLGMSP
jgi:vacuolar-type H+-ATPase subunit E/Vma4